LAARYGGEEFVVLLPDTDAAGARFLAQHLLQAVEVLQIPHAASPVAGHVTLSIGVACCEVHGGPWVDGEPGTAMGAHRIHPPAADLLAAADQALYAAKAAGRRQACYRGLHDGAPAAAATACLHTNRPAPHRRVERARV
jgi:PleD family two-component response regulator